MLTNTMSCYEEILVLLMSAVFPAVIDLVWQVFPLGSFSWVGVPTVTFGMGFDILTPDWSFI